MSVGLLPASRRALRVGVKREWSEYTSPAWAARAYSAQVFLVAGEYDHTVSGLLRRRSELMEQIAHIRERMALLTNDIEAIDRVLDSLGYTGELPNKTTRTPRVVLFVRNELARFILDTLRASDRAMTSRELAEAIVAIEGKDKYDRGMMNDITKRVGKAGRQLRDRGLVMMVSDRATRRNEWRLA